MTGPLPPHVCIKTLSTADATRVEFSAGRRNVPAMTLTLEGRDRLERAIEEVDEGLRNFKRELSGREISDADLRKSYEVLEDLGDTLWYVLFGNSEGIIHAIKDFWESALPPVWDQGAEPPLIECVGNWPFPVDYLPILGNSSADSAGSRAELLDCFRTFVGFSCQVQRKMLIPQSMAALMLSLDGDGKIPVRYLHHDSLRCATEELSWFRSAARHVRLEGPYPDGECAVSLAKQIFDPRVLLSGSLRATPDQIQHFACHCYTTAHSPLDSEIELHGSGASDSKKLKEIGKDLSRLGRTSPVREYELPLVFLNACGSARMGADSAFSFPRLFLDNGNRGFIGTEIEMPDSVASAFSRNFYERFLNWGMPLGRAMLETRRHLLYAYGNPLGIAYVSYADPELSAGS